LTFDEDLPVGSATLNFSFTGILNDQMRGFYLSKYTDADGNEQRLATTQFEATDCRRAMPCWSDEQTSNQTTALICRPYDHAHPPNAMLPAQPHWRRCHLPGCHARCSRRVSAGRI